MTKVSNSEPPSYQTRVIKAVKARDPEYFKKKRLEHKILNIATGIFLSAFFCFLATEGKPYSFVAVPFAFGVGVVTLLMAMEKLQAVKIQYDWAAAKQVLLKRGYYRKIRKDIQIAR